MKNKLRIFLLITTLSLPTLAMSEEDSYLENESSTEYVETSEDENIPSEETTKYQYDINVYPYVSVKFTSIKTKKYNIEIDDF